MRTIAWCRLALALGGLLAGLSAAVRADDVCEEREKFDGRPYVQRAQTAEQAGRFKEAHAEASKAMSVCARQIDAAQVQAMTRRLAGKIGEQEERAGRPEEAARWYLQAERVPDADRAMLKHAQAASQNPAAFHKAWSYFDRGRPGGRSASHIEELRKIAAANGERELAAEGKHFTPLRDTLDELGRARDWLRYVDRGEERVNARAVARGDALARDDAPGPLERALPYYRFAGDAAREKALRERAGRLGDAAAAKGDAAAAVRYYELAGLTGKAAQLARNVKAQEQKAEAKRRQAFDKDTKALEKELGL